MRKPKVRWDARRNCWRSDVGPLGRSGRRTPVYFREHDRSKAGERAAARELAQYLERRDMEEGAAVVEASNPPVDLLGALYLRDCRRQAEQGERDERTCASHAERLRRWVNLPDPQGRPYGSRLARSLTDGDGQRVLEQLRKQGCGAQRIAGVWRSVNAALNWAARRVPGRVPPVILERNPFAGIKPPSAPRVNRRLATRPEVAQLLRQGWRGHGHKNWARFRDYDRATCLLVRAQYHTGCRPGELCGATWGDWRPRATIDEHGHAWGLLVVRGKTTRRTGELRHIPVPPVLARAIERRRPARCKPTDPIFRREARKDGSGAWDAVALSRWVKLRREAVGLGDHVVLYGFRRLWYTEGVEANLTTDRLGQVGGTSAKVIEDVYAQQRAAALVATASQVRQSRRRK